MTLINERQLANTRAKLCDLEALYEELRNDAGEEEHVRRVSMRSIKKLINQLKEEVAHYEAHQPANRSS